MIVGRPAGELGNRLDVTSSFKILSRRVERPPASSTTPRRGGSEAHQQGDVVEESVGDARTSPLLQAARPGHPFDAVASFAVNDIGLGHASRLIAVHDELRRERVLTSTFFVQHELELIADYGFDQVVLPRYEWHLMESGSGGESGGSAHELAQAIVWMALRGTRPIVLHDVFIHRAVYQVAVAAGWPQALIFRPRLGIVGPAQWLRTVAPAVSVVFVLGQAGYEEHQEGLSVIGVGDVVRAPLGDRSMWEGDADAEVRIVVTAGGGGRDDSELFLNAAIAAVDIVSRRSERRVAARIVTGPFFKGQARFPASCPARMTLTRYLPPTYSLYADASVVVAQAGYNTVHELERSAVACVLVPLAPRHVGDDDQRSRAEASRRRGVYVAQCDPNDIALGIEALVDAPASSSSDLGMGPHRGEWQIATLLEVMSGA